MKSALLTQIARNGFSGEIGPQSQIQLSSNDPASDSIEPAPTERPPTSTSRTRLSKNGHRAAAPLPQRQRRAPGAALRAHSTGSRTRARTGTHTHRPGGTNQRPPSKFLYLRPGLAQSSEAEPEEAGVFGLISLRASYRLEPNPDGLLRAAHMALSPPPPRLRLSPRLAVQLWLSDWSVLRAWGLPSWECCAALAELAQPGTRALIHTEPSVFGHGFKKNFSNTT